MTLQIHIRESLIVMPNMNAGESYSSGAEHTAFEVRVELNLVQGRTEVLLNLTQILALHITRPGTVRLLAFIFQQQVRFKAEAGLHTIYAYFTDPVTGDMAENSRSSTVTFRLGPSDAPRLQQPPPQMQVELPNAETSPN